MGTLQLRSVTGDFGSTFLASAFLVNGDLQCRKYIFVHTVALTPTVNQKRLKFDGALYATYNFDDGDRLTNIVNASDSTTISFGYDNENKLTSRILPNGITTTYEYDDIDRLTRLRDASSTATLFDRQYGYNTASQISSIVEPTNSRTFGYDFADRLKTVTASSSQNESYNFDVVGNRTSTHLSNSYGYQPFNKLTSTQTATYNYNANGNMVSKSEGTDFWRYSWDSENRLTSASTRKQTVRYKYDALGRRVQRSTKGSKENTKFIYDGQDVLVDDDGGTLTKYQNGLGIDNKLSVQTGSNKNYFLADHLGSTNGLADSSGNLTSSASYDSFGNATGNLNTRYQFTGREKDDFTGLHYYRARFYDGKLGRFISEDPIGFAGGDVNLYGYVGNNPNNLNDPLGLFPDNPYELISDEGWTAIAQVGNFAAGFGDTVTLGGTRYARQLMGSDHVVDPCSWAYFGGDIAGTILPMFIGGAGAARGALAMGGKSGSVFARFGRGAKGFFYDPRKFGTVSNQYWRRSGGFGPANGRHLHHWFTPQRVGGTSARWNLMELPGGFNSWMGWNKGLGRTVEKAIAFGVPGAIAGGAIAGGYWGIQKNDWKSTCECK